MIFKRENALKEFCSKWKQDSLYCVVTFKDFRESDNDYLITTESRVKLCFNGDDYSPKEYEIRFTHLYLDNEIHITKYAVQKRRKY